MPGAEPFEFPGRSDVGVLLAHGFTGSPFELRPVGEALAAQGIGSVGILLRGHGTHPDDMVGCTYADWLRDLEDGLTRLLSRHERAVIVGLSMGGTLVLNVAARWTHDARLAGLVTISAPIYLSDWRLNAVGLISRVVKWNAWGKPDIKDRSAWDRHVAYRRIRTRAIPQSHPAIARPDARHGTAPPGGSPADSDRPGQRRPRGTAWQRQSHRQCRLER
jgi:esterase/lipase